jgi:hypothetical protein
VLQTFLNVLLIERLSDPDRSRLTQMRVPR